MLVHPMANQNYCHVEFIEVHADARCNEQSRIHAAMMSLA